MAIEIKDLPMLEDLTPEQLKELFGAGKFRPEFEALEERSLMSASSFTTGLSSWGDAASLQSTQTIASAIQVVSTAAQTQAAQNYGTPITATGQQIIAAVDTATPTLASAATVAQVGNSITQASGLDLSAQVDTVKSTSLFLAALSPKLDLTAQVAPVESSKLPSYLVELAAAKDELNFLTSNAQKQGQAAIDKLVSDLAGTWQAVGKPLGGGQPTAYGYARFQFFENGKLIVWSPDTGAHMVEGLIAKEYLAQSKNAAFPKEANAQFFNGYPTSEAYSLKGWPGAVVQDFAVRPPDQKSVVVMSIVWTKDHGAHAISDYRILQKWRALGGGSYGVPISGVYATIQSTGQNFLWSRPDSGLVSTIVSSQYTGTHDVVGAIRDRWMSLGGSAFGNPVTDQTVFAASGNRLKDIVHFNKQGQNSGAAIANLAYGPVFVVGHIYKAWISSGGAEGFGWPTGDEHAAQLIGRSNFRVSNFRSSEGKAKAIYWTSERDAPNVGVADLADLSRVASHFYVDNGDGRGPVVMDFTPQAGPTGFEPVTGSTSSALSVDAYGYDLSAAYQTTAQSNASAIYSNLLDLSAPAQWVGNDLGLPAAYAGLFGEIDLNQEVFPADLNGGIGWSQYADLINGGWDLDTEVIDLGAPIHALAPYFTLPLLNSNPGAAKTIFLDFQGGYLDQTFRYKDATPSTGGTADAILNQSGYVNLGNQYLAPFDLDGKLGYSAAEQAVIKEIWQRVAEDFAPFNVNVTTDWSGALTDRNMLRVVFGGGSVPAAEDMADRYGISQFDSIKQGGPNLAFVFTESIKGAGGNLATLAANVASREAGHAFGLRYRPLDYPLPDSQIMGTYVGHEISRWGKGTVPVAGAPSAGSWADQDDLKTLTSALGLREDDHGEYGGFPNLGNLDDTGTLQGQGVIGIPFALREAENPGPEPRDVDTFSFQTSGGKVQFEVKGVGAGQNLETRLEVWSSLTQVGKSPLYIETGDLNATVTLNLPAGTYYVKVMGGAGYKYGNLGQYTLNVSSVPRFTIAALQPLHGFSAAQEDLKSALAVQTQLMTQNENTQTELQAAALALSAADQALAAKSVAFAKAEATFKQINQSTLAFQAQSVKKTHLQAKVVQANVKYRQALKAQKANHNKRLNASRRLAVNKAKASLIALNKQLKAQITIVQNAGKKMKAEAPALNTATAARAFARGEVDAARINRDQAAQSLSDLQTTHGQLANALVQAQQQMVKAQDHVNQLVVEQANVKEAPATAPTVNGSNAFVATVTNQNTVNDSQSGVAALAAQLIAEHSLGSYHPEWTADNWLGRGERWILSTSNEWYFITPDGGLYRYNGSEANSALLATLDQSYWENLDLLFNAS